MYDNYEGIKWDVIFTVVVAVVGLAVVAWLVLGSLAIQGITYPAWLGIQRNAVENSKSFTDANNNMLATYILEYGRLDVKVAEAGANTELKGVYQAQQKAIVNRMCTEISTMKVNTVNPQTKFWLNSKGGCQ